MGDLSTNFSRDEFACECGCGRGLEIGDIDPGLIVHLEGMRAEIGRPMFITSGCRCPQHNKDVGGVENSVHTLIPLQVADIKTYSGAHKHKVQKAAHNQDAQGVGTAAGFIHADWHDGSVKPRPAAWDY